MPLFITYASYSNAGIKGIMDKPIDRTEPIRTLVEKAGGKLIAAYMTTGPHDVVIVTEQADGIRCGCRWNGCSWKWRRGQNRNCACLDAWRIQGHCRKGVSVCRSVRSAWAVIAGSGEKVRSAQPSGHLQSLR